MLGVVAVICLGLGGWHLFLRHGQYIEAEPAVVGQPIKIHGRFFHFGRCDSDFCVIHVFRQGAESDLMNFQARIKNGGFGRYDVEFVMDWVGVRFDPGSFGLKLMPDGHPPIHGKFTVRPAE
jgi:hypothetical protein